MNKTNSLNRISRNQMAKMNTTFRKMGLNFALIGTKLIGKAIQIIISSNNEYFVLENIYREIAKQTPTFNPNQIKNAIAYSLKNRNENISEKNFEDVFDIEYDEFFFTNDRFIEEVFRIIMIET